MLLGVAKIVCVKSLDLVLPEAAQQYGIAAEAPVFLSPYINGPQRCSACRVTYTPVVYQAGYTTRSQHWHQRDSGIYFHVVDSTYPLADLALPTGWLAVVEPVGRTVPVGPTVGVRSALREGRAEAVYVRQITAWCMGHYLEYLEGCCLIHEAPFAHTAAKGVLVAFSPLTRQFVMPVCAPVDADVDYVPFTFRVRDGTVFFSNLLPQIA